MREFRDNDEGEGGGGFPVGRLISALRRRWRIVAALVVAATCASALFSLTLPNLYEARAVVQIDPREKTISNLKDVISDLSGDAATIESEVEIISSRAIALKVIDILDLRTDPELTRPTGFAAFLDFAGLWPVAETAPPVLDDSAGGRRFGLVPGQEPGASNPRRDEIAVAFADRLKVQRVRSTLLISISFRATDPVKAAKIVNTIAEVYLAQQLEGKQELTSYATEALERKLAEMRGTVMAAESKVEAFKAKHGIFAAEGQILSEKQMARLMEQTIIARNETAIARAKWEQARRMKGAGADRETISEVLDSHTVRLMREKLAEATRRRAELATKYGPRHPDMVKIQAEVRDARRQLDAEVDRLIERLENEFQEARDREAELAADLAARQRSETDVKSHSVKLKELEREAETSRQIFEALLQRYKQTAQTQDLQLPDARIVEAADVPLLPSSPKRRQIVLIGFAAGFALGLLIVLGQEFATPGIGRPEDVETVLELPHLASMPVLGAGTDAHVRARLTIAEPGHAFVDAIRHARRELDLETDLAHGRVVVVCAALPGEGTSLIASNLAHHYALTGQRALLIDADLRRAKLSAQLAPVRASGLSSVLAGRLPPESAILQDQSTNLCFLPATPSGPSAPFNPEVLASPIFEACLGRLRSYFDVIVVDTAPILPVIDTQFVADHADQIVFVTTWRKTPKALAKKALRALGDNRDRIVGAIVNQVDPEIIADELGVAPGLSTVVHA